MQVNDPAAVAGDPLAADGRSREEGPGQHEKLADELIAAYKKEGVAISLLPELIAERQGS